MPKQNNTITITFWLVLPQVDLSEVSEMQALGNDGVFEPSFQSGERQMLAMSARFDPDDVNARYEAALYAIKNAKRLCESAKDGGKMFDPQVWVNGEKLVQIETLK